MRRVYLLILLVVVFSSCKIQSTLKEDKTAKVEFNQDLADELSKMVKVDQLAASNGIPPEDYKYFSIEEWREFKDSVFRVHQKRLDEIFNKYGYPGFDLVGENGSSNFWLMTQHCDFDPTFQIKVLNRMRIEVEKENASPIDYAYLTDRVLINTGQNQLYGTQTLFNFSTAQAYPKNLADSVNVNNRRAELGLEPIEEYLNQMSQINFDMNKEIFLSKGINGPKLYKTK